MPLLKESIVEKTLKMVLSLFYGYGYGYSLCSFDF